MGLKSAAARWLARKEFRKTGKWLNNANYLQQKTFEQLTQVLHHTAFGKDHKIGKSISYDDWKIQVPLRDYEALKPWIDRVVHGEEDVLWKGRPRYLCKTSGTTSGVKYIPMSEEGIKAQITAARSALLHYIHRSGNTSFVNGKMIFLQGSPVLHVKEGIRVGRLSGIVAHHVPQYLQSNRLPSWRVNTIEDWESKVDAIVEETKNADLRLVSGIPPWVQMYFEKLLEATGKPNIAAVFPNLSVFAHGGVNYEPYKPKMQSLLGKQVDSIETYPASEGFIAFQDDYRENGLLLNLEAGIFYEFVPVSSLDSPDPVRLQLNEVELDVNYAIVLNTSSGLWGYVIGDTVKFVSLKPYKIIVTGRIKHFISAFGEHVIAEEVENAMSRVCAMLCVAVNEFHVAPQVNPAEGLPYHEWIIEWEGDMPITFAKELDHIMRELNTYYNDLIEGKVLQPLVITKVPKGSFNQYMKSLGKLGGQHKMPRLSNERKLADAILTTLT